MKLTTSQLKKIIAEEVKKTLSEGDTAMRPAPTGAPKREEITMKVKFTQINGKLYADWNDPKYKETGVGTVRNLIDYVETELGVLPPRRGARARGL